MNTTIQPLTPSLRDDFYTVLGGSNNDCRTCMCTAYYWDEWETRGKERRDEMFERGETDGYLLYVDGEPAGWCQCAPVERLRLADPAAGSNAEGRTRGITCMVLRSGFQGRGLSAGFLRAILDDLAASGCRRAIAVGHRPEAYHDPDTFLELPASICEKAGMTLLRDDDVCPIYESMLPAR